MYNNNKQLFQSSNRGSRTNSINFSNKSTIKSENSLKELKSLKKKPLQIKCDIEDLQQIILTIRNYDAKVHKVMTELLPPHIDKDVITVDYINSVMRSICNQLNCIKLDRTISLEDTLFAFNQYVQSSYEFYRDDSLRCSENNQDIISGSNNNNIEEHDDDSNDIIAATRFDVKSIAIKQQQTARSSNSVSSGFTTQITTENNVTVITTIPISNQMKTHHQPSNNNSNGNNNNLQNSTSNNTISTKDKSDLKDTGNHVDMHTTIDKTKAVPENNDNNNTDINTTNGKDIYNNTTATITTTAATTTTGIVSVKITLTELYATCWEGLIKLFIYVNDRHRSCIETLFIIEEIIQTIDQFGIENLTTPILAFTVDTFIQQAIQSLTDKVSRVFKSIPKINQNIRDYDEQDISVDSIEACISIASKVVIPICSRIQEHFHTHVIPNLPYPTTTAGGNNFGCNKLPAICNKLQDLLIWCGSYCCRKKSSNTAELSTKTPSTFPFVCSNMIQVESKDTSSSSSSNMIQIESKDTTTGSSRTTTMLLTAKNNPLQQQQQPVVVVSNDSENNIEYFYQQHPEILLDNVRIIDDALELTLKEFNAIESQGLSIDLMKHVQQQLYNIVYTNISSEISLSVCGSTILKLPNINNRNEVDYLLALGYQYSSNIYEWDIPQQLKELDKLLLLNDEKDNIQHALDSDLTQYNAIQQLHSILKELDDLVMEYVNKLNLSESYSHCDLQIIEDLIQDKRWFIQIAQKAIRSYEDQYLHRLQEKPAVPLLIQHLEEMQNNIVEDDNKRNTYIKKSLKVLSKTLKDSGFHEVNMVSNRSRFLRLSFVHSQTSKMQLHCNIILSELVVSQTTKLIRAYLDLDITQKIHSFIHMIKIFVNAHALIDMNNGLLSIAGWYVLALHFLLHFEYLPNIHMDQMYLIKETLIDKVSNQHLYPQQQQTTLPTDISKNFLKTLPTNYKDKIDSVSLIELFEAFLRYYVEKFDIYSSVVTLRGKGIVLSKSQWEKDAVLWRLSIEDPFDCMYSSRPFDLGKSLTKNGQVTIFKALKRAIYGIRTILVSDVNNCHNNVKKLFSKQDLIHISRRFHNTGLTIIDSFKLRNHSDQVNSSIVNLIDTKEYKYYELQTYRFAAGKYLNTTVVPTTRFSGDLMYRTAAMSTSYEEEDSSRVDINHTCLVNNNNNNNSRSSTSSAAEAVVHNNIGNTNPSRGLNINSKPLKIRYNDSSNASVNDTISVASTVTRTLASSLPATTEQPLVQKRIIRYRDAENNQLHTKIIHIRVDPSVIRYQQSGPTIPSVQQQHQQQVNHMILPFRNISNINDSKQHLFLSNQKNNDFEPPPRYHHHPSQYSQYLSERAPPPASIISDRNEMESNRRNDYQQQGGFDQQHLKHQNKLLQSRDSTNNSLLSNDIFTNKNNNMISSSIYDEQPRYNATTLRSSHSSLVYHGSEVTPRSNTYASTTTADHSTTTAATSNSNYMIGGGGYKDRILNVKPSSITSIATTTNYNDENKKKSSPIVPKISLVGITSRQNDYENDIDLLDAGSSSRLLYTDRSSLSASSPRFDITPRLVIPTSNNNNRIENNYNNHQASDNMSAANYYCSSYQTSYRNHQIDSDRRRISNNNHEESMYINHHSDTIDPLDHINTTTEQFPLSSLLSKKYLSEPYQTHNNINSARSDLENSSLSLKQSDASKKSLDLMTLNQNISSNDFDDVLKQYEYNNNRSNNNNSINVDVNNHQLKHSFSSLPQQHLLYDQKASSSIASLSSSSSNQQNEKHSKSSEEILNSYYSYQSSLRLNSNIEINPIEYSPRSCYSTGLTEESHTSRINCVTDPLDIISFSNTNNIIKPHNYNYNN